MIDDATLRMWEMLSYLVTVLGLPFAAFALWREMRAERANEEKELEQREDEIYVALSQQYSAILEAALAHPELDALDSSGGAALTGEQQRRQAIYYEMLLALFERAFILLHEDAPSGQGGRRWQSWADFFAYWLKRPDFARYVENNLQGEDPAFTAFVRGELGKRPERN